MRAVAIATFGLAFCALPAVADAAIVGCSFSTASVTFGTYDPTASSPTTASGSVSIDCLLPTTIKLAISGDASGAFNPRSLAGTGGKLAYLLSLPGGGLWGDGSSGTGTYSATFGLLTPSVPIAGSLVPQQSVTAGSYSGSLTITATF